MIDIKNFKPRKMIHLNPSFGSASSLVGGADADIIIDDFLIDIKVTKMGKVSRNHFNQLITYYLLDRIEKEATGKSFGIKRAGNYFARHGCLTCIPIEQLTTIEFFNHAIQVLKDVVKK